MFFLVAVVALGAGAVYRLMFPTRTDYAGHFLAGLGGTLLLLAALAALTDGVIRWGAVGVMVCAVAAGAVFEATVFRLATFDPVDFFNQSLGAVVAAACVVGRRRSGPLAVGLVALGLVALGFGFRFAFA